MTPDFLNHVRNCFLIHVIECAECMAALESGQATAPRPGQCGFLLDAGTTPPVLCPHERDGDAVWCALHIEAMVEAGGADFAAGAAVPPPPALGDPSGHRLRPGA